jgi:uncharacterized membrane protein YidH (DUF202 family)
LRISEQDIPARIRTLLALERNYLSEERTALAEFRTGLALAPIGCAVSVFVAYIFPSIPTEGAILFLMFLVILVALGVWTSLKSRARLEKIRERKRVLKDRQSEIIRSSKKSRIYSVTLQLSMNIEATLGFHLIISEYSSHGIFVTHSVRPENPLVMMGSS